MFHSDPGADAGGGGSTDYSGHVTPDDVLFEPPAHGVTRGDHDLDMADKEYDVLVIGATGYTGRLVIEYLANHKRASSLRIAIGGRTLSKVQELANKYKNVGAVHVDVSAEDSVIEAVAKTRVVINIAGPYWTRGSVVVKACARTGVHYVDLTGETPWIHQIIQDFDYIAHKNRAVIVPCSGYDSIPSDIAAFLAVQALEKQLSKSGVTKPVHITSTAMHQVRGGISGGTAASIFSAFEEVPRDKMGNGGGWELSPVPGPPDYSPLPKLVSYLPHIEPRVYGGFFIMSGTNAPVVRRSWGLRERYRAEQARKSGVSASPAPTFSYSEFLQTMGPISSILLSLTVFFVAAALALLPPVRWLAKQVLPKSGEGPSPEKLDKGRFEVVNVAEGGGIVVKSHLIGKGDPGYRLTSFMIVESALLLLDPSNLTPVGREGGILTPSAAFGDKLVQALEATGRFQAHIEILGAEESRKTR